MKIWCEYMQGYVKYPSFIIQSCTILHNPALAWWELERERAKERERSWPVTLLFRKWNSQFITLLGRLVLLLLIQVCYSQKHTVSAHRAALRAAAQAGCSSSHEISYLEVFHILNCKRQA